MIGLPNGRKSFQTGLVI